MECNVFESFQFFIRTISFGVVLFSFSCVSHRELRGKVQRSKDHGTYLVIKEKDNPSCSILVDGEIWVHEIGNKGTIKPGIHTITCGGSISITIKEATTFYFDYWGP